MGVNLSEHTISQLFNAKNKLGFGMALSSCKEICETLGGEIKV